MPCAYLRGPRMIIKTRKLPETQTEGERMRATAGNGATLTIPFPYAAVDPHYAVAQRLAKAMNWDAPVESDDRTFHADSEV